MKNILNKEVVIEALEKIKSDPEIQNVHGAELALLKQDKVSIDALCFDTSLRRSLIAIGMCEDVSILVYIYLYGSGKKRRELSLSRLEEILKGTIYNSEDMIEYGKTLFNIPKVEA